MLIKNTDVNMNKLKSFQRKKISATKIFCTKRKHTTWNTEILDIDISSNFIFIFDNIYTMSLLYYKDKNIEEKK